MTKTKVASNPLPSQTPPANEDAAQVAKGKGQFSTQNAPESEKIIANIGHNSDYAGTTKYMTSGITGIEKLEEKKRAIMVQIRESKKKIKNETGVEVGVLNEVIKLRKMERETAIARQTQIQKVMEMVDPQLNTDLFAAIAEEEDKLPSADVVDEAENPKGKEDAS